MKRELTLFGLVPIIMVFTINLCARQVAAMSESRGEEWQKAYNICNKHKKNMERFYYECKTEQLDNDEKLEFYQLIVYYFYYSLKKNLTEKDFISEIKKGWELVGEDNKKNAAKYRKMIDMLEKTLQNDK